MRDLPVGIQQRVEILKALYRQARVLILDEPTAVLTPQEATDLFRVMRTLATEQHTSIVFITHKLHEVFQVADRIVVLRQGKVVGTLQAERGDRRVAGGDDGRAAGAAARREGPGAAGRRVLRVRDLHVAVRPRAGRPSTACRSRCAPARSWASPACRATARRELVEALTRAARAGRRLDRAARRAT